MAEVRLLHGGGSASAPRSEGASGSASGVASGVAPGVAPTPADITAVAFALRQMDAAHRRLRTRLAHRLNLTVTDLTALLVISEVSESTPKRLAAELGLTSGTVTSVIDRLVDSGHVRRVPKAGDRRSILIELTPEGAHTIETVNGLYLGGIAIAMESAPHLFSRLILDSLRRTADAVNGTAEAADVGVLRSELTA